MIKKNYLLFLAGIIWSIAGYNVLHIGCMAYAGNVSLLMVLLSVIVFAFFQYMVFGRLVKKHTKRIKTYDRERQWFWKFFDGKSFVIMAFMMSAGIIIRVNNLCPDWFIAFFYTGLGFALFLAGINFFYQFGKVKLLKEEKVYEG